MQEVIDGYACRVRAARSSSTRAHRARGSLSADKSARPRVSASSRGSSRCAPTPTRRRKPPTGIKPPRRARRKSPDACGASRADCTGGRRPRRRPLVGSGNRHLTLSGRWSAQRRTRYRSAAAIAYAPALAATTAGAVLIRRAAHAPRVRRHESSLLIRPQRWPWRPGAAPDSPHQPVSPGRHAWGAEQYSAPTLRSERMP